eukprot:m51a1_g12766 hypothetical protein (119) ;mRNA; r:3133-3489
MPEAPTGPYVDRYSQPLRKCLEHAPTGLLTRAVLCDECGTRVWSPGALGDGLVDRFLRKTLDLTSPFAKYDPEECLTLLHNNNYDVQQALAVYQYAQNTISRRFLERMKAIEVQQQRS